MPGWGAYVSENEYQNHIATYVDQSEVSVVIYWQQKTIEKVFDRSIHASHNTMPWSELVLGLRLVMQYRGWVWLYVRGIA